MANNGRHHSTSTNEFNLTLTGTSLSGHHQQQNNQQSSRATTPKQTSRPGSARSSSYLGGGESTKRSTTPQRQGVVHTVSSGHISSTPHRSTQQGKENRTTAIRERRNSGSYRPAWFTQATSENNDDRTNHNQDFGTELRHSSSSSAFRTIHSPRDSDRSPNPPSTGRIPNNNILDTQSLQRYSDDIDAFFTDDMTPKRTKMEQTQSQPQTHNDIESSWDDTRRWIDEINQMQHSQSLPQQNAEHQYHPTDDDTYKTNDHNASTIQSQRQPSHMSSRGVGPSMMHDTLMSRDSLSLMQSNYNPRSQQLKASQIAGVSQQTPMELDLRKKMATVTIQRWYRKVKMRRRMAEAALKRVLEQKKLEHQASAERTRELEKFTLLEQKRNREEKARNARLVTIKDTQRKRDQSKQQQDADLHRVRTPTSSNRGSYSSRTGIKRADSNSRTPRLNNDRVPSPMPPKQDNEQQNQTSSIGFEKVNKSISGGDISEHVTLTSSTSSASKVTLNDVYETLRKLEQVEQFPLQRNESAYLNDSTLDASDTLAENNSRSSKPLESILSYLDQETQKTNDITIESVRSQKSTSRLHDRPPQPIRTSTVQLVNQQQQTTTQQQREDGQQLQHPPIPYNVRFANSDHTLQQHSNRSKDSGRQTPTSVRNASDRKLAQSLAMPHMQQTDSQRQYQISTPHKSLAINPSNTIHDEHNNNEEYSSQQRDSGILYDDQNMDKDDDIDDYATRTTQDVTQQILKLRMNNEEKQRTVFLLQQRLNQQRELNVRHAKEADREMMHRLQLQKEEYESAIKRHLTFIDQLIDDKKKLSERCEKVVNEIKLIDKKYSDKIRLLEDNHRIEIQKLKDVHEAAEKLRRERWIDEKTKKIKELTVRGLEPEIQKLISKHKAEIQKIKSINEAELLQSDERAAQRYVRMTEELRDQLEREKEQAIMRERDSARERYEKAIRDEEKAFTEQRRRLFAEIEEEKNRLAEQATKQRNELDKLRKDVEDNHRNAVDAMKREYEAARLEQERRHQGEIRELKEKLEIEKQSWEENYMKKQETNLAGKERELRDQMKRERDKEIEKVISQLETDTTMSKEEAERAAENRVKRIRDKYESELREVEYSERQTQERYNQLKAQYTEVEGDNERFKVIVKQKDTEINDIRKITDTLQKERERLSDIIRQEFADRLVLTEDENKRLKIEMAELRSRQQIDIDRKKEEIDTLQREKDQELEKVHEKIKQAITKKDEQVTQLRQQFESAVKRADHLEGLLEQQRKLISTPATANTTNQKKS